MKVVLADGIHGERGFYKIINPTKRANDFITYSIPAVFRFIESNNWYVHEEYVDWIRNMTKKESSKLKYDYELFHLLPTAPMAIVESSWRHFAAKYHPDKGGDEELFKEYNAAYQRIKESTK